ncbi:four helix bundle protein [Candidatus Daviesbacteria bacterium RIFCSPHIGHO2_12_FULL_43_11]|uniref:Four helix bundle protein n=1 Tax=Candidatus Daviesbacteria bacterium RIFCSPHIGHO2_12_FULL_43_11 TaxID=1797780 RepID=A0A1F5K5P5_9BACT|nr:MAG: four helix bundle protein [Candidatus Daviesbacteria bacterium RIFCSPHIGHO2_01_FULL_43_17]OGE36286.1 MAG: four helix bundle protein [Candidatus Daviesbacteria bacterium RIFCSPHIGHO2_12_FULL_43_11]OGE70104.1 MAG: four helix bundle protein [Candidatus Daviesbacteria bacterium RIFCSPLOWO2_02_FULL_43_11]
MNTYKDLIVWQESFKLARVTFEKTIHFPKSELYGLVSQMRRAAVSIPSNIAEGYSRGHRQEYIQFLRTALGSATELETQILLSKELNFLNQKDFDDLNDLLQEVLRMLKKLILTLKP